MAKAEHKQKALTLFSGQHSRSERGWVPPPRNYSSEFKDEE